MKRLALLCLLAWPMSCAHMAGDAAREAAREGTPTAVDQTLRTVETPENRKLIAQFLASPEMREGVRRIGQNVTEGAFNSLGPRIGAVDAEEMGRSLSRGIVLGADEALRDLERRQEKGQRTGLLGRLSQAADTGFGLTNIALLCLGALLIVLTIWVVHLTVEARRQRDEVVRHDTALAEALRNADPKGLPDELRQFLDQHAPSTPSQRH